MRPAAALSCSCADEQVDGVWNKFRDDVDHKGDRIDWGQWWAAPAGWRDAYSISTESCDCGGVWWMDGPQGVAALAVAIGGWLCLAGTM